MAHEGSGPAGELEQWRSLTGSDFAALAIRPAGAEAAMRWTFVAGGRSDRLLRMTVKPGVGLAGMALRHGVPYPSAGPLRSSGAAPADPVMLAEQLVCAVAYPLAPEPGGLAPRGVVLMGRRSDRPYDAGDRARAEQLLPVLSSIASTYGMMGKEHRGSDQTP